MANPERSFLMGHKIKAQTDIDRHLANLFDDQKFRPRMWFRMSRNRPKIHSTSNARGDDGDEICDELEIIGVFC